MNATTRRELGIAACLFIFGAAVVAEARRIPQGVSTDPLGPAAFPTALGWGIALCGLLLGAVTVAFRDHRPTSTTLFTDASPDDDVSAPAGAFSPARLIGAIAVMAAYLAVFTGLGYVIATPLFVAAIMLVHGGTAKRTLLIAPLLVTAALYLTFRFLLRAPVPDGILEGLLR